MSIQEAEELCARYIATGVSGVFFAPLELTDGQFRYSLREYA